MSKKYQTSKKMSKEIESQSCPNSSLFIEKQLQSFLKELSKPEKPARCHFIFICVLFTRFTAKFALQLFQTFLSYQMSTCFQFLSTISASFNDLISAIKASFFYYFFLFSASYLLSFSYMPVISSVSSVFLLRSSKMASFSMAIFFFNNFISSFLATLGHSYKFQMRNHQSCYFETPQGLFLVLVTSTRNKNYINYHLKQTVLQQAPEYQLEPYLFLLYK